MYPTLTECAVAVLVDRLLKLKSAERDACCDNLAELMKCKNWEEANKPANAALALLCQN